MTAHAGQVGWPGLAQPFEAGVGTDGADGATHGRLRRTAQLPAGGWGESAGRSRRGGLAFRDGGDGVDAGGGARALPGLTGYELWDRTRRAGQQVAAAYGGMIGAGSAWERVAVAPEFLRRVRQLLELRLVAVAAERRRAFAQPVPPAGGHGVAALWAEVFWAARARSPEDDSGVLEAADAAIRELLALQPSDLADPDTVRGCWERLERVEETFGGLEMEAQATVEGLQAAVEHEG